MIPILSPHSIKMNLQIRNLIFIMSLVVVISAATTSRQQVFSFEDGFNERIHGDKFIFIGPDSSIDGGALQLTPDTINDVGILSNKFGRILYYKPFKLWPDDDDDDTLIASFTSTFVINIFRKQSWIAGHGLAFLITPQLTIPSSSYGQWLGLSNATTDGDPNNLFVAIEFDTFKQDFDPDDNHIALNINSIRSTKAVSLDNFNIKISPEQPTNYTVWVHYHGISKLMEVYMVKDGDPKPLTPLLNETINLKTYLKRDSYFGFAASTGDPEIQLNCVLKWSLEMEEITDNKIDFTLAVGVGVPILVLVCGLTLVFCYYLKRKKKLKTEPSLPETLRRLPGMPREFKYKELNKATNNFNESMKLGQGGFGVVYKGVLDSQQIAVKKFSRDSIKGKDDFLSELTIIHRLRHKHLVRLLGWCHERGKLLLVYDFMPNGSLEKHLYLDGGDSKQNILNWERRYKIITGVASALHYLHREYDQTVVHRDLKASNIMLDLDFNARLGDFGLARVLDNGRTSYAELGLGGVPGTMGYVAPECFHTGKATPESDVFGFGAVVLEVVCGRNPGIKMQHREGHSFSLVEWVWMLHREGRILEAVDETLKNEDYVVDEATRLLLLGLACSHPTASERPQTQAILPIISGNVSPPHVPPFRPVFTWPSMNFSTNTTESTLMSISVSS